MTASGHVLAKNTMWNLVGAAAPLLVAVLCIPILVDEMGAARFGILALAWVVIGYFGLFDLGLGRALTKLVADELGAGREEQIPVLAWTALTLMLALGIGGGLILGALTPQLVRHILKIPVELQAEASGAFYVLAASIPVVISTAGLRPISALISSMPFGCRRAFSAFLAPSWSCLFHTASYQSWRCWRVGVQLVGWCTCCSASTRSPLCDTKYGFSARC